MNHFAANDLSNPISRVMLEAGLSYRAIGIVIAFLFLNFTQVLAKDSSKSNAGGTLRVARLFDPVTFDPPKVELGEDLLLLPLIHQTLLDVRGGTNIVPGAARAWSMSPDARVYTFQLRPGVRFSNGREVVANDYVFALERLLNPKTACAMGSYFKGIRGASRFKDGLTNHLDGVTAPTPDTLVIELERPDPTFGFLLVTQGIALPQEEIARLGPRYGTAPIADGPYVLGEWKRGARLCLKRNPYYHGIEPQHFDTIEIFIGGDETTHLMMFERGELDLASITGAGIPFPSFRRLHADPRWHDLLESEGLLATDFIILNTEIPPWNNVQIRRALNYAINRDKWERVAWGYAAHAEGIIPPMMPGFNPAFKGYKFDPDKARELVQASGQPLPIRSVLWHGLEEPARFLAQGVQADARQIGIEIELKPVTYSQLISAIGIRRQVPMSITPWLAALPDCADILGQQFDGRTITNSPTWNAAFYQNPVVDRLLDEAAPEVNLNRRFQLYQQVEQIVVEAAPCVFLGHTKKYALRQSWVKGSLLEPLFVYRLDRIWNER